MTFPPAPRPAPQGTGSLSPEGVQIETGRRYRIIGVAGQGAFGAVYRAELLGVAGFRKLVAIKMLHPAVVAQPEAVRRLRDEARILARVRHHGIVQVDALVQLQGRWAVIMEFLEGATVRELVDQGPVSARAALELVGEVAESLGVAVHAGDAEDIHLVHRDIKPSNLLLDRTGGVKLLDFGVARADFGEREGVSNSKVFGSPDYMAPERWQGVDEPAADVYSLGVVLLELLTGSGIGQTWPDPARHARLVTEGLSRLPRRTSPFVSELLAGMLSFDPAQRPSAEVVSRLCSDLSRAQEGASLRDVAEEIVPRVVSAREPAPDDPLVGQELAESANAEPPRPPPWWARNLGLEVFLVVVAVLVAVLVLLVLPALKPSPPETVTQVVVVPASTPAGTVPAPPSTEKTPETPAPMAPAPVAVPQPPAPRAPASPAPSGRVRVEGDATSVRLVSGASRLPPGSVPAGSYAIEADFGERGKVEAGRVTVAAGQTVTIRCDRGFALCTVE